MEQTYSKRQAARDIFRLAWPTVMEQILTTAVSYVDTAMVGHIGPDASAAVGVTMTVNWLINGTVSALGIGFLAYIARAVGARQHELARRASAQAVLAVLLSGVLFTILPLLLAAKIPEWMNADPHLRSEAAEYFFILYIPMLFRSATIIFGTVLRASGDTRTPMVVNGAMNAVNVVLNFFFIYETRAVTVLGRAITMPGLGLGVSGAAIASAISFVVGGVWMTAALLRNPLVSPRGSTLRPDSAILKPCLRVAIPAALQRFATSFGYVAFSSMINTLGATSTAAHTIANTAESAFYIPGYGMQAAASTLIGTSYGENDRHKMRMLSRMLLIIEFIVMTLSGAALFFGAEAVMSLFTQDEIVSHRRARFAHGGADRADLRRGGHSGGHFQRRGRHDAHVRVQRRGHVGRSHSGHLHLRHPSWAGSDQRVGVHDRPQHRAGRNAHGAIPARPLESIGRKLTILTKLFPVAVRLNVTNCM